MTILEQLETLAPQLTKRGLQKQWLQLRKQTRASYKRLRRTALLTIRQQYYLWDAAQDLRSTARLNEDIIIGGLLISSAFSFASVSLLANIIYTFMLAAAVISTLSGANLALLALIAFGMLFIFGSWLIAFAQNMLNIGLMDGATRKKQRSLRTTIRRAVRASGLVTSAWWILLAAAFGPAAGAVFGTAALGHAFHIPAQAALPYVAAMGIIAAVWAGIILATYSLVPSVALFEPNLSWVATFARARQLVLKRGRLFIVAGYLAFTAALAAAYGIAVGLQALTHTSSTLIFMIMIGPLLVLTSALQTVFYRKRKLARR